MTIKETFTTSTFEDAFKVVPINVKDHKGKDTTTQGTPDMMPILLGLSDNDISHRLIAGKQAGLFIPAPSVKPFMTKSMEMLKPYIQSYVKAAQEALGQEMGVDIAAVLENGMDGFQISPDDPRITEKMLDNTTRALDLKYPTGPLYKQVLDDIIDLAAIELEPLWGRDEDNYKCFVSMIIFNVINTYARQATDIVNQQVFGPIVEILQYKQYAAQQQQMSEQAKVHNKQAQQANHLVGLAGEKLSSESINELTLPDSVKQDKIIN